MRLGSSILLVLVGCTFRQGAFSTGDDAHTDDVSIGDGPEDALVAIDGNNDRDNDTIPNASDNCPDVANQNQWDFDGDGLGDVCDHCPHIADPLDPDSDKDTIGDACDPRPLLEGDQVVVWTAFRDATEIAGWGPLNVGTVPGAWALTAGGLQQSTIAA